MRSKLINGRHSTVAWPNGWNIACVLDNKNGCACLRESEMDGARVMEDSMIRSRPNLA